MHKSEEETWLLFCVSLCCHVALGPPGPGWKKGLGKLRWVRSQVKCNFDTWHTGLTSSVLAKPWMVWSPPTSSSMPRPSSSHSGLSGICRRPLPLSLSHTSLPWVNWSFYLHIDMRGLASCLACAAKCSVNTGCNPSYDQSVYGWPPYYSLKIPLSFPWRKMYWTCVNSVTAESTSVSCHHYIPIFWQC